MLKPLGNQTPQSREKFPASAKKAGKKKTASAASRADRFSRSGPSNPDLSKILRKAREKDIPYAPSLTAFNRVDQVREKYGLTGKGVGVVSADTGFAHPQYRPALWVDLAGKSPEPEDQIGHGTQVAGCLLDMAPQARLISLRMHENGFQPDIKRVARAFDWAAANREKYGIRVLSLSLAVAQDYETFASHPYIVPAPDESGVLAAAKRAVEAGITVVVAAGNWGPQRARDAGEKPHDPARGPAPADKLLTGTVSRLAEVPGVIVVGSSIGEDQVDGYSSRGPALFAEGGVDILAPGDLAVTLDNPEIPYHELYTASKGTSVSTPQAAGVAALLYEADPELTPQEVKEILKETARALPGYDKNAQGAGHLDALAALERVYQLKAGREKR